ncbi:DUF4242 domain-containing protein [Ferruginibacter albus]|uniref:DUF4242 domain-containing protein n=1 Tax=Ferruginibacter albus TaxID=2875540 RepID=UPI001CC7E366|nr:DUF4242 domain-containing protein [Ferruginibacter albus]
MKTLFNFRNLLLAALLITGYTSLAQTTSTTKKEETMKTYLIERDIPSAGNFTAADLKAISQKSCSVLKDMGSDNIQWVQSYVTDDKIFCVYKAKNEDLIREHGAKGGFPVTKITEISSVISPATAQQ